MAQICSGHHHASSPEPGGRHRRESAWRRRQTSASSFPRRNAAEPLHLQTKVRPSRGHHKSLLFNSSENCLLRHARKVGLSGQFLVAWSCNGHTSCLIAFSKRTARMPATLHYQSGFLRGRQAKKKGGVKSVADGGNECVESTIRKFANGRRSAAPVLRQVYVECI